MKYPCTDIFWLCGQVHSGIIETVHSAEAACVRIGSSVMLEDKRGLNDEAQSASFNSRRGTSSAETDEDN
jgi:hypothetical protein